MEYLSNINSLTSYLPELMIVVTILAVFIMESISSYRPLTYITTIVGLIFLVSFFFLLYTKSIFIIFDKIHLHNYGLGIGYSV